MSKSNPLSSLIKRRSLVRVIERILAPPPQSFPSCHSGRNCVAASTADAYGKSRLMQTRFSRREFSIGAAALIALLLATATTAAPVEWFIDPGQPSGEIDLTRYALGQGGLSHEPMFDEHLDQIARLKPQT